MEVVVGGEEDGVEMGEGAGGGAREQGYGLGGGFYDAGLWSDGWRQGTGGRCHCDECIGDCGWRVTSCRKNIAVSAYRSMGVPRDEIFFWRTQITTIFHSCCGRFLITPLSCNPATTSALLISAFTIFSLFAIVLAIIQLVASAQYPICYRESELAC